MFFGILALAVTALAFAKGGPGERSAAAVFLLAFAMTGLADWLVPGHFYRPEFGIAAVDLVLVVFLAVLAIRSARYWPIWALGFHSVPVLTHLAVWIQPKLLNEPYAYYASWWSVIVLLALALGCFETPGADRPELSRSSREEA